MSVIEIYRQLTIAYQWAARMTSCLPATQDLAVRRADRPELPLIEIAYSGPTGPRAFFS
jgi:hypothetical protein